MKCQSLGESEKIFNTFAVTKTGAYVVTSDMMYRVWTGADDQPYVVWSEPYDTVDPATNNQWYVNGVKNGQYELGSGTSPTILGEGKYVAITDNDEPMKVVVFRTDEPLDPNEDRKVCEVSVFEDQEGGANSNSLIGSRLSLIVENTYDYAMYWQQDGKKPSAPGFERIDINPNGKGCTKVWSNPDVASTISGRLSTRTGLLYVYARKMDTGKADVEHPYGLDVLRFAFRNPQLFRFAITAIKSVTSSKNGAKTRSAIQSLLETSFLPEVLAAKQSVNPANFS